MIDEDRQQTLPQAAGFARYEESFSRTWETSHLISLMAVGT
jgi:hypothetical protein